MDELTANISFDKFVDLPEFYGSGAAGYRLAMVKERADFLDLYFEPTRTSNTGNKSTEIAVYT